MKKSIKKLTAKEIKNTTKVKGGNKGAENNTAWVRNWQW